MKMVKLTDSDVHKIVKESTQKILQEINLNKQDFLYKSKTNSILKKIYNVAYEINCKHIMDLCVEAQSALLAENGF